MKSMNDDISGIWRMAGIEGSTDGDPYSQMSGNHYSQFTPTNDPNTPTELETDDSGKKLARKNNFTPNEDLLLVSAWLNTSLEPIHGTDQKSGQYWNKIEEYFKEYGAGKYESRTDKSLQNRWSTIQQAVNKFCGFLTQVELARKSGFNGQDLVYKLTALYELNKCSNGHMN